VLFGFAQSHFSNLQDKKYRHNLNALLIDLSRRMQCGTSTDARLGPEFEQDIAEVSWIVMDKGDIV
jgi:hypothetical protein